MTGPGREQLRVMIRVGLLGHRRVSLPKGLARCTCRAWSGPANQHRYHQADAVAQVVADALTVPEPGQGE